MSFSCVESNSVQMKMQIHTNNNDTTSSLLILLVKVAMAGWWSEFDWTSLVSWPNNVGWFPCTMDIDGWTYEFFQLRLKSWNHAFSGYEDNLMFLLHRFHVYSMFRVHFFDLLVQVRGPSNQHLWFEYQPKKKSPQHHDLSSPRWAGLSTEDYSGYKRGLFEVTNILSISTYLCDLVFQLFGTVFVLLRPFLVALWTAFRQLYLTADNRLSIWPSRHLPWLPRRQPYLPQSQRSSFGELPSPLSSICQKHNVSELEHRSFHAPKPVSRSCWFRHPIP